MQCDSKLLSGFPWPIIFKTHEKIKLLTEYESVTQEVLLIMLYFPHFCLREKRASYFKMATAMCVL
jgi:hypothetical protein